MPRSKKIEDYFEIELDTLRPEEEIPFPIHLYFPTNSHIITWRDQAERITRDFLENYRKRGLQKLWIHRDDRDAYHRYVNPPPPPTAAQVAGQEILQTILSTEIPPEQKKEIVQTKAQELLQQATAPETVEAQRKANEQLREAVAEIIQDVFDETRAAAKEQFAEIWKLANIDPDFEHGLNVSTFAVVFAMAFGRIDQGLLADLAFAGLLHDIGLCQVPLEATSKPWQSFAQDDLAAYSGHVDAGIAIITYFAPENVGTRPPTDDPTRITVPERVRSIISQHHEKFDGSGYPKKLQGFQIDDIAQLLAISEILDSFASGQWDGTRRTLAQTFDLLEGLEKARTFPEYFNPDVFAAVVQWIRGQGALAAKKDAVQIVQGQAKQLIQAE